MALWLRRERLRINTTTWKLPLGLQSQQGQGFTFYSMARMGPLYGHSFTIGQYDHTRLIKHLDYQMRCHPVSRNVTQNSTSRKMCLLIMLLISLCSPHQLRIATYCELNTSYHRKKMYMVPTIPLQHFPIVNNKFYFKPTLADTANYP